MGILYPVVTFNAWIDQRTGDGDDDYCIRRGGTCLVGGAEIKFTRGREFIESAKWLNMMEKRLELSKHLLKEDGVILSIPKFSIPSAGLV